MLIDYLRYVAFAGRLRSFFEEGFHQYVEPSFTTGQHLRFAPSFLEGRVRWHRDLMFHSDYWNWYRRDGIFEELKHDVGLAGGPDILQFAPPQFEIGGSPSTFHYKEVHQPELEIIIDVDPEHWTERIYAERRNYEGVPIIYRRAGPARGDLRSGDKLRDRDRTPPRHGTLCGIFCTSTGLEFALTCGHVIQDGSFVLIEQLRRRWKLPFTSNFSKLGETRYRAICPPANGTGPVKAQLDAALIAVEREGFGAARPEIVGQVIVTPITTVLQEEPVRFRGAGRSADTLARVSAVTVRKSMDLYKDGTLRDVGDVLMLGHRYPMYIVQRVSRPGDSGAAVRRDNAELNQWEGMVLGSDETGAYATHAEHLWAWAAKQTGDPEIDFAF